MAVDLQDMIFRSVAHWSGASSTMLFLIGIFFALQGFRFARPMLAFSAGVSLFAIGAVFAPLMGMPPETLGGAAGISALGIGLVRPRIAAWISAVVVFGILGHFLATRVGLRADWIGAVAGTGCLIGAGMPWIANRSIGLILTTLIGAGTMIVGFVAVTGALLPPLAETFSDWAGRFSLLTPVMLLMFFVLGYSIQANAQQGDIMAGGGRGLNDVPAN